MKRTGASIVIESLCRNQVETVFGYPGGAVLPIYDQLYQNAHRIHHVQCAHEQNAAHAADGYARVSGKPGVVLATSGPGTTNLVTGIANAYLDSVPLVAITGNAAVSLLGRDSFQEVDTVFVPVGGGVLLAGVSFVLKSLKKDCKVYGVQAEGAPGMCRAYAEKRSVTLSKVSTFADGIAVKTPGTLTRELCCKYADGILTVSDDEIAAAILTLMEKQKLVAEGAGAAGVAAVLSKKLDLTGKKVCAVVSGGNIDVNILSRVINRGLLSSGRVAELKIAMLDKPGQLQEVSKIIADCGANVIQVRHDPGGEHADIIGCYLHIKMETRDFAQFEEIKRSLTAAGYHLV